jgi:hypothetical protein
MAALPNLLNIWLFAENATVGKTGKYLTIYAKCQRCQNG